MRVLVLGCGPAGLMAAQGTARALSDAGEQFNITVASIKKKSPLFGCQYLHQPIPYVTPQGSRMVSYQMRGTADDYRRKVYGQMWDGTVSPEDLTAEHRAWDLRATYERLWGTWEPAILDTRLDPVSMSNILSDDWDVVINSIPRPSLCHQGHAFGATEIWAAGDAPSLGIVTQYQCPEDMVVCNGDDNPSWYRLSRVFGHTTIEWPGDLRLVPVNTAARVRKPTSHNCDCWPTIKHVGRYGRWEKGVLSHTAYFDTYDLIKGRLVKDATAEAGA